MMAELAQARLQAIAHPRVLLVEGEDEVHFMGAMTTHLGLTDIDIRQFKGVTKLPSFLPNLKRTSGFNVVTSLGIIRDADSCPDSAFQSVATILEQNGLNAPAAPVIRSQGTPAASVLILPDPGSHGALEDLCLRSMPHDPALECVDAFTDCIAAARERVAAELPKSRVRAFLISRELLEIDEYEAIRDCLALQPPQNQDPARLQSPAAARIHLLLCGDFKPDIRLGESAEAGYWPLDDPAFQQLREYLRAF
jgi:hypothetical protein